MSPHFLLVLSFSEGIIRKKGRKLRFLFPLAIIVEELPPRLGAMTSIWACLLQESTVSYPMTQLKWTFVLLSWNSFTNSLTQMSPVGPHRPLGSDWSAKWKEKMEKVQLFSWFIISQLRSLAKSWHNATAAGPTSFLLSLVIWQVAKTLGIKPQFLLSSV